MMLKWYRMFRHLGLILTGCVLLALHLAACGVEVPGGGDDLNPPTPNLSIPTATPVIFAPSLVDTPTSAQPLPTPLSITAGPSPLAKASAQPTTQNTLSTAPSTAALAANTIQIPPGAFTMGANNFDDDEKPS